MRRDAEGPTGLGLEDALCQEPALGAALSRHFHSLLSVSPQPLQAESEVLWGWGPPAKGLTH